MASLGTALHTLFFGSYVGQDQFGNRYYRKAKGRTGVGRIGTERRWVTYKGIAEPSKVPPGWHAWLHHITDDVPDSNTPLKTQKWQQEHQPNLTGTEHAYQPPGHLSQGGKRDKATGDYEAWRP